MRTELYKARAHIGCEGNELADTGAKTVASGDTADIEIVSALTTHTPDSARFNSFTMPNGDRISKPKSQLRQTITNWMTTDRGYKTTVSDMWGGEDASNLDKVVSNAVLWGTGKARGIHRPLHVLRFRFLETVTKRNYTLKTRLNTRTKRAIYAPRPITGTTWHQ